MKKIELSFISIFLLGLLFTFLRLPFANMLMTLSIGSLAFFYMYLSYFLFNELPVKGIFKIDSYKTKITKFIGGGFLGMILAINIVGSLFKFMHWPGANMMMVLSLPIIAIVVLISFYLFLKNKTSFYKNILLRYMFWGLLSLVLFSLPKYSILEYQYKEHPDYIEAIKTYDQNPSKENGLKLEEERAKMYEIE